MAMSDKRQIKKIEAMSKDEKLKYFCGGRVTVGRITQLLDNGLRVSFAAKIRGVVIGNNGEYLHPTQEEARTYGKKVLANWRAELEERQAPQNPLMQTVGRTTARKERNDKMASAELDDICSCEPENLSASGKFELCDWCRMMEEIDDELHTHTTGLTWRQREEVIEIVKRQIAALKAVVMTK